MFLLQRATTLMDYVLGRTSENGVWRLPRPNRGRKSNPPQGGRGVAQLRRQLMQLPDLTCTHPDMCYTQFKNPACDNVTILTSLHTASTQPPPNLFPAITLPAPWLFPASIQRLHSIHTASIRQVKAHDRIRALILVIFVIQITRSKSRDTGNR